MKNHSRTFTFTMIAVLLLSGFAALVAVVPNSPVGTARAEMTSATNAHTGDRIVFFQNYTAMSAVPSNFAMGNENTGIVSNMTLEYNSTTSCVEWNATFGQVGKVFIGGLATAMKTNISFDLELNRTNQNTVFNLFAGNSYLMIQLYKGSVDGHLYNILKMYSVYYNPSAMTLFASKNYLDEGNAQRFNLTISSDSITQTNFIYLDGSLVITSPFIKKYTEPSSYVQFSNPYIYWYATSITATNWLDIRLHSVKQTVPAYQYITPISNQNITSFGLDGPHAYEYIDGGLAYLTAAGGNGTLWADYSLLTSYSAENLTNLKNLITNGWELGIHTPAGISSMSYEDACAYLDSNFNSISATFGQDPTSYVIMLHQANTTHYNYAYDELSMVWRSGYNGDLVISNVGNIADTNWPWWSNISAAGICYPTFTHRTDETSAITYSISYNNFKSYVDNYAANGIKITSFIDYWRLGQNTYYSTISDLSVDAGAAMSFTLDNIGGKSRLFIAAPWASYVITGDGGESVPFETVTGGIIIEVEAGDYAVYDSVPSFTSTADVTIAEDATYSYIPIVDQVVETWNISTNASWLTVYSNGVGGTPTNAHIGSYYVNVTATNIIGTVYQNSTIVVTNTAPTWVTSPSVEWSYGVTYSYDPGTTDEGDGLTYTMTASSTNLRCDPASGAIRGKLTDSNTVTVSLMADDGHGSVIYQNWTVSIYALAWDGEVLVNYTEGQNLKVTFNASLTNASYNAIIKSVQWNFGDGNGSRVLDLMPMHPYERAGTYTVTVYVVTVDDMTATKNFQVTVGDPAVVEDLEAQYAERMNQAVLISGLACAAGLVLIACYIKIAGRRGWINRLVPIMILVAMLAISATLIGSAMQ